VSAPTALVTGATGGIGRALVASFSGDGLRVRAVVRPESVLGSRAAALADLPGVAVVESGLDDEWTLTRTASGCEVVVHLAAQTRQAPRRVYERTIVGGTAAVVRAAWRARVARFVQVSSTSVYGPLPEQGAISERAPLLGRGPYAEAKIAAETVVEVATSSGLPAVVLRPTLVYGEGVQAGLPAVLERLAGPGAPASRRHERVQPVHVADVVRAVRGALGNPEVAGPVNVAGPETVDLEGLLTLVDRLGSHRSPGPVELREPRYSTERMRRELGVRARVGLVAGLTSALRAS
jgi:nucleoside-diphosphate-sugar epimerase